MIDTSASWTKEGELFFLTKDVNLFLLISC